MQYILGAYSQLPFGSFDEEFEALYSRQLRPLLTMIYQNPSYKLLMRLSCGELEYLEANHPEINMLIGDLCRKGQLELLSSSFHDVVLSLIPTHERSAQVEKTTTYIRKRFSKKPKGLWCYNQVFSPQFIPMLNLSGLEYIVMSCFNQQSNSTLATKPFYMDEMGKGTVIFPTDDRFSKETADYFKSKDSLEKYIQNIEHLAQTVSSPINTIMINMDQLLFQDGSSAVFSALYKTLGGSCTLPNSYLADNEIIKTGYLPAGVYGRDFSLGKASSINQYILDNPQLSRNYGVLNTVREAIRDSKKNSDERKNMENLLMKASSSSLYIPVQGDVPPLRRNSSRYLCEIESILSKMTATTMPLEADADCDRTTEYIINGKSIISYLKEKGAVLSRLIYNSSFFDFGMHDGKGIFSDSFINTRNGKEIDLSNKIYEVTPLDKRRVDFFAKSPQIELEKVPVLVTKRFKFRQSTVIAEIEIENLGNVSIEGFIYENTINLAMPKECVFETTDGVIVNEEKAVSTKNISVNDKTCPYGISIALSDSMMVNAKEFMQNCQTWLGDKSFYEYTQLKIQKKLTLKPMEDTHFTIGLKIEKRKERNNDTTE